MKSKLTATFFACLAIFVFAAGFGLCGEIQMPGKVNLDTLVDKYEPVEFDHEMHTFIAKGCADCHHSHMKKSDIDCQGCHDISTQQFKDAVKSGFMSCSMCHSAPDPETPSMPSLKVAYHKKCFGCHRDIGDVGKSPEACTQMCHAAKQ